MIEKQNTADAGDGLSCEAVANWRLGEMNRYVERITLTTYRDDLVAPGDTIAVVSPNRLGVNRNFLCKVWMRESARQTSLARC